MSKNRRTIADPFHDRMRRGERILLLIYLPIHIFAMPALLALLMTHMGIEYTEITLNFLYYAAGAVLVFLIARRFLRAEFDPLCDNWMKVLLSVLEGYLIMTAMALILSAVKLGVGLDGANPNNSSVQSMLGSQFGKMFTLTVLLAPLVEEPIFRGAIFSGIRVKNRIWAYIITILLFGLYHVWQYAYISGDYKYLIYVIDYIPATFALCWTYDRTDTIWSPIALHMLINAVSLTALGNM